MEVNAVSIPWQDKPATLQFLTDITERKQAEAALQLEQNRYHALFEQTNDAIFIANLNGICIDSNQQASIFLGYPAHEIIGQHVYEFIAQSDIQNSMDKLGSLLAGEKLATYVRAFRHKNGSTMYGEISLALVHDAAGQASHFHSMVHDVTKRVQIEQALLQSVQRLLYLRQMDKDILGAKSPQEISLTAVQHIREFSPIQQASFIIFTPQTQHAITYKIQLEDEAKLEEGISTPLPQIAGLETLRQGRVYQAEEGTADELRLTFKTPLFAQGDLVGVIELIANAADAFTLERAEIIHEVTNSIAIAIQQMRLFTALKTSEQRYRSLFDEVPIGLYRATENGQLLEANPAFVTLLGYPDQQALLATNMRTLFTTPEAFQQWQARVAQKMWTQNDEVQVRQHNGAVIWAEGNARAFRNAAGQVTHYEGSLTDITERIKAEAQRDAAYQTAQQELAERQRIEQKLRQLNRELEQRVYERTTELKTTNTALQESQTRYRAMIEEQEDFIIRWRPDGTRTFVNESYCKYKNMTFEDLVGTNIYTLLPDHDKERLRAQIQSMTPEKPTAAFEYLSRRSDNVQRWIHWRDRGLFDKSGTLFEVQSVGRDTTEYTKAKIALQESEENLRATLTSMDDLVFVLDGLGRFANYYQPKHVNLLYAPPESFLGKSFREVLSSHLHMLLSGITEVINTGKVTQIDYPLQIAGSEAWFSTKISMRKDRAGKFSGVTAVARNVTARKRAEALLQKSEGRYRSLTKAIPDTVFRINQDYIFTDYKPGKGYIYAPNVSEVLNQSIDKIVPATTAKILRDNVNKALQTQQTNSLEFTMLSEDEKIQHFEGRFIPVAPDEVQLILRDITERKQKETALQKAHDRLATLFTVSQNIVSTFDFEALQTITLAALKTVVDFNAAFFTMREDDKIVLTTEQSNLELSWDPTSLQIPLSEIPIFKTISKSRQPYYVADARERPEIITHIESMSGYTAEFITENLRTWLVVPLIVKDEIIGMLNLAHPQPNQYDTVERELIQTFTNQVAIAIENARLYQEAQETAVIQERARLARELHDAVTQSLFSLTYFVESARRRAKQGEVVQVQAHLDEIDATAHRALREMRLLLYEMQAPTTENNNLVESLRQRLNAVERRAGMQSHIYVETSLEIHPHIAAELYRIAQEALNNTLKHTRADLVTIRFWEEAQHLILEITDNGQGFELAEARNQGGMGLENMQTRAKELGGTLEILTQPAQGTTIRATVKHAHP